MITVLLFNILNFSKNPNNFPRIIKKNYEDSIIQNREFVLILDEMSGIESIDSNEQNGEIAKNYLLNFLKKNKFNIYTNSYSDYGSTLDAVPTALNGVTDKKEYSKKKLNIHF